MVEEKDSNVLSILFPGEDVEICKDQVVRVTPVSLKDFPKVLTALTKLFKLTSDLDAVPQDIAITGFAELLELLSLCIDRPTEEIPSTIIPELLEAVLAQNLSESMMGKWKALIRKVVDRLPPDLLKRLPDQSKASKT